MLLLPRPKTASDALYATWTAVASCITDLHAAVTTSLSTERAAAPVPAPYATSASLYSTAAVCSVSLASSAKPA